MILDEALTSTDNPRLNDSALHGYTTMSAVFASSAIAENRLSEDTRRRRSLLAVKQERRLTDLLEAGSYCELHTKVTIRDGQIERFEVVTNESFK